MRHLSRRYQLSANPEVRPVFWWLLGGAGLLFLLSKRKTVESAAEQAGQAVQQAAETVGSAVKEIVTDLQGVVDKYVIAKKLKAAIDSELPNLSEDSKLIMLAQAISENGWNVGRAAVNANNFWNITAGPAWSGAVWLDVNGDKSYTVETCQNQGRPMSYSDSKGKAYCKIDQKWRKYPTINAAVVDYWDFLGPNQNRGRYVTARKALEAGNVDLFVSELRKAGYYDAPLDDYRKLVFGVFNSLGKYLA